MRTYTNSYSCVTSVKLGTVKTHANWSALPSLLLYPECILLATYMLKEARLTIVNLLYELTNPGLFIPS